MTTDAKPSQEPREFHITPSDLLAALPAISARSRHRLRQALAGCDDQFCIVSEIYGGRREGEMLTVPVDDFLLLVGPDSDPTATMCVVVLEPEAA
jgi:hypothetical protein